MPYGAGYVAASQAGAEIVDPRRSAAPGIAALYARHPHLGPVLPALGYAPAQLEALRRTVVGSEAEVVVTGTPVDLASRVELERPVVRARYAFADLDEPGVGALVDEFLAGCGLRRVGATRAGSA
jgi:predicted GTPase